MRVILIRHAEAAPGDPDAERPLTAAGRAAAHELAARLAPERPSVVLSSPLLRALETATPIAEAAGATLQIDGRLEPGADLDDLRAATSGKGEPVVVVGHQPDCSEIVLALTGERVRFPPGGTYDVDL